MRTLIRVTTLLPKRLIFHRLSVSFFLLGVMASCCRPPESALRQQFEEHKSALDTLVRLSNEDLSVVRITPKFTRLTDDWSWPRPEADWGITEARWNRYRQLFEQAGVKDGISRADGKIFFFADDCGLSISGRSSGYVYSPQKPSPVVQHLSDLTSKGVAYVHLGGDWYLYTERD